MNRPMGALAYSVTEQDVESTMSDQVFAGFQRITLEQTGIELAEGKRAMIVNRFSRRLLALGLTCFEEYLTLVADPHSEEALEFIETVTTNLTYFYRESHHFEVISKMVLPELARRTDPTKPIRIWSAACSSGQEPYTLAITVRESEAAKDRLVRILCTDIDSKMVAATQAGCYRAEEMRGLSQERRDKWFERRADGRYDASELLRSLIICKRLNLFDNWPIRPGVDVIMCRNVLIYFNPDYQKKLLQKFSEVQNNGGYLFLGHSESIDGFSDMYRRIDNTVYERI